jgi:hypothetical protein
MAKPKVQPKKKEYKIYALTYKNEQKEDIPFYVGVTSQKLSQRKAEHVYGARVFRGKNKAKEEKIRELDSKGQKVNIELLEGNITTLEESDLAESLWIMEYKEAYPDSMTNVSTGSDYYRKYSERLDIHSNYFLQSDIIDFTPKSEIVVKFAGSVIGKVETSVTDALLAINQLEEKIVKAKQFNGYKVNLVSMFLTNEHGKPERHVITGLNFEFIR